jgi:t-SNARE complex subunit (syntaxin)|tara:strand:+ start:275 stop:493 length:219 start_codon:yes stop_codon:yes gene_type:complete
MEIYNSKELAEDIEGLKMTVKTLEAKVDRLEKSLDNLVTLFDSQHEEVEDLQNRVDFIEDVDISEVEKPHGV